MRWLAHPDIVALRPTPGEAIIRQTIVGDPMDTAGPLPRRPLHLLDPAQLGTLNLTARRSAVLARSGDEALVPFGH